jgi:hypothetical protein
VVFCSAPGSPTTPRSFRLHHGPEVSPARPRWHLWSGVPEPRPSFGPRGGPNCAPVALAVALHRKVDRGGPPRMFGSRHRAQPGSLAPFTGKLCRRSETQQGNGDAQETQGCSVFHRFIVRTLFANWHILSAANYTETNLNILVSFKNHGESKWRGGIDGDIQSRPVTLLACR